MTARTEETRDVDYQFGASKGAVQYVHSGFAGTAQHGWPQQYQVNCFKPFIDHTDPLGRLLHCQSALMSELIDRPCAFEGDQLA